MNKEAIIPIHFNWPKVRAATDILIFTETVTVCPCVDDMVDHVRADIDAVATYAANEPKLTVSTLPETEALEKGTAALLFQVPRTIQAVPKANENNGSSPGNATVLEHALRDAQLIVSVCTGGTCPAAQAVTTPRPNQRHALRGSRRYIKCTVPKWELGRSLGQAFQWVGHAQTRRRPPRQPTMRTCFQVFLWSPTPRRGMRLARRLLKMRPT